MTIHIINEAKEAPLYHCTSVRSALSILKSGELRPAVPRHDQYVPPNIRDKSAVCFTRSNQYTLDGTYYVQFVFDQAKLVNNYKVRSVVNRRYKTVGSFYGTQNPENSENFESEERVLTDKPIPVRKYLVDIRLVLTDACRRDLTRMLKDGYYGDRDLYDLYSNIIASGLPAEGFISTIESLKSELIAKGERVDMKDPEEVKNPGMSLMPRLDYVYDNEFTRYAEGGEPDPHEVPSAYRSAVFFHTSIYDILDTSNRIPELTLEQLKPHIKDVRLMDGQMDPDRVKEALKVISDNNIKDPADAGRYAKDRSQEFLIEDLVIIITLGLPCESVDSITKEVEDDMPIKVVRDNPDELVVSDGFKFLRRANDRVVYTKIVGDIVCEFTIFTTTEAMRVNFFTPNGVEFRPPLQKYSKNTDDVQALLDACNEYENLEMKVTTKHLIADLVYSSARRVEGSYRARLVSANPDNMDEITAYLESVAKYVEKRASVFYHFDTAEEVRQASDGIEQLVGPRVVSDPSKGRGVYSGPLFHCTAARNAVPIIEGNMLKGNYFPEVGEEEPYICFTTNPDYLFEEGNSEIRFEFDSVKLSQDYKLEDYKDFSVQMEQYEVRVYTDKITNMMDYVTNIEIINEGKTTIPKALRSEYIFGPDDLESYSGDIPQLRILQLVDETGKGGHTFDEVYDALNNYYVEELEIPDPETKFVPAEDSNVSTDIDVEGVLDQINTVDLVDAKQLKQMFKAHGYDVYLSRDSNISGIYRQGKLTMSITVEYDNGSLEYGDVQTVDIYIMARGLDIDEESYFEYLEQFGFDEEGDKELDDVSPTLKELSNILKYYSNLVDEFIRTNVGVRNEEPKEDIPTDAVELSDDEFSVSNSEDMRLGTNPGVHGEEFSTEEPLVDNEPKTYHPDIAGVQSVTSDKVVVELKDGVVAEFKLSSGTVTGVVVRKPGKRAVVYGGRKAIPPYYRNLIASGVVMEIYNDMFQEEVVEPIDMEDDNVRFYVSFEGRDVVIEAEILVNNLVKYDLVRDYLVNALGMDDDFVKRTTTVSAPSRDLWIGRINSYFEQIQAKLDEYVPVVDEVRDTVGLIMQDLIKPKGFNIIEVSDDSIKAEIEVGNAKITVDMDAYDADIYVAGIKLSDYPDLVADMDNAGYTNIREYTDDSIKIMESISEDEDIEEFANRISELLDMITNGVVNAPAEAEEESLVSNEPKNYHPDIAEVQSVTSDRVIVKFTDDIVAEFKIAMNNVTGVIVRRPGKKAQVYGGTKAIPPYYKKLIASGVVMEIYNDHQATTVQEEPPVIYGESWIEFEVTKVDDTTTRIVARVLDEYLSEVIKSVLADLDFHVNGAEIFKDVIGPYLGQSVWESRLSKYILQIRRELPNLVGPIELSSKYLTATIELETSFETFISIVPNNEEVAPIALDHFSGSEWTVRTKITKRTNHDNVPDLRKLIDQVQFAMDECDAVIDQELTKVKAKVPSEVVPEEIPTDSEVSEPTPELDDPEEFLSVMSARRDFKKVEDYKFRYIESDDNYDFEVEFDDEYDVVYFIVHCADKNETEFINRVMGNAYKFSGYTGQSVMTLQMDLGDLSKMVDTQVKKFDILVDETLAQSQAKSDHAISAELVAKPQHDPEQESAAKRLEKFVRTVLAPIVDADPEWNSFFIDTPKEFKRYRLRTVGIMLTCYDMKSGSAKLKANPLFKKMSKAKKVVIQRGWQKALDPDGNKCWMCIFIDAEYAKAHGRELLEEKVTIEGSEYLVKEIYGNNALLESADESLMISTGELLNLL